ncbi:MAG: hypothetical protein AAGG75_11485 [Bacteroidota bacterium]
MKAIPIFLILIVLLIGCSKSKEPQRIMINPDPPLHSEELNSQFRQSLVVHPFAGADFDHYLVIHRSKGFRYPGDAFTKIVYATSKEKGLRLEVGNTSLSTKDSLLTYTFSNPHKIVLLDGIEADHLPENEFDKIDFSFCIGDDLVYEGNFPELSFFAKDSMDVLFPKISKFEGRTLTWNPSAYPGSKIRLLINHHGSTIGVILPDQELIIDDTGSFTLGSEHLSRYSVGDYVFIHVQRDVYFKQDGLLLRAMEDQNWAGIITL